MFDKDALQELQEAETISRVHAEIAEALDNETKYPIVAAPNNYTLHDLEKYMPNRVRFRGELKTQSLDHFCGYVKTHDGVGNTKVFIDEEDMSAKAIFNIGTHESPGHCDDTAELSLKKTAPFRALLEVNGRVKSQRDMAEWLEDWVDYMAGLDSDGKSLPMGRAISQVRNIEIKQDNKLSSSVTDFSEKQTAESNTRVSGSEGDPLPAGFTFTCEPWAGLPESNFYLRLSPLGEKGFNLRIVRLEAMEEKIVSQFKGVLSDQLGDSLSVIVGTFK